MTETTPRHGAISRNRLITSNPSVSMTAFARDGRKLGSVHSFIVDKPTGQVAYAVLSFGGFLGLGQKYVDKALLEGSPSYRPDDAPEFNEAYGERISTYYDRPGF